MLFPYPSLIGNVLLILDVLAIVSLLRGTGTTEHKVVWSVLILVLPFLGLGLYLVVGRGVQDAPLV